MLDICIWSDFQWLFVCIKTNPHLQRLWQVIQLHFSTWAYSTLVRWCYFQFSWSVNRFSLGLYRSFTADAESAAAPGHPQTTAGLLYFISVHASIFVTHGFSLFQTHICMNLSYFLFFLRFASAFSRYLSLARGVFFLFFIGLVNADMFCVVYTMHYAM